MCIFLLFPCQCSLQSYTSYGTPLQISDKEQTRLRIYCPAQMWIICLPNGELPGNGEECPQEQFFHLSGVVGALHRQVCKVDTCIAKHMIDQVQPGCSASTASHRIFYEDTSLFHLNWLRCFCFHSAWKWGVVEKSGKKCHSFPDSLYFSFILIYLNCLHFKIAQRTKYKAIEELFCIRDLLQLSFLTLPYKISRACTSRISLQVMQASNKK